MGCGQDVRVTNVENPKRRHRFNERDRLPEIVRLPSTESPPHGRTTCPRGHAVQLRNPPLGQRTPPATAVAPRSRRATAASRGSRCQRRGVRREDGDRCLDQARVSRESRQSPGTSNLPQHFRTHRARTISQLQILRKVRHCTSGFEWPRNGSQQILRGVRSKFPTNRGQSESGVNSEDEYDDRLWTREELEALAWERRKHEQRNVGDVPLVLHNAGRLW